MSAFTVFTCTSQPAAGLGVVVAGENWLGSPLPDMVRCVEIGDREMITPI